MAQRHSSFEFRNTGIGWRVLSGAIGFLFILVLWQLAAGVLAINEVPSPLSVAGAVMHDGVQFYLDMAAVSVTTALWGFLYGTVLAGLLALIVIMLPLAENVASQVAIVTQCIPAIAIGPVLLLVFGGRIPGIVMGALSVFFPVFMSAVDGLKRIGQAQRDLVKVYGGSRIDELLRIRLVLALPSLLSGLQIAFPAAVLGAIIGEYLGGVDSGIGVSMAVSQSQLNAARTWAFGIETMIVTFLGYYAFGIVKYVVDRRIL